ncbi:hypothetical protein, partial [Amycolatopsis thailandensis]|uniref:hypothetical protein n=1 Tax=Amycolatopsis thailandensis TaxID=589330 RepID=UPI001FC9F692
MLRPVLGRAVRRTRVPVLAGTRRRDLRRTWRLLATEPRRPVAGRHRTARPRAPWLTPLTRVVSGRRRRHGATVARERAGTRLLGPRRRRRIARRTALAGVLPGRRRCLRTRRDTAVRTGTLPRPPLVP